jgi:hypothetical protein
MSLSHPTHPSQPCDAIRELIPEYAFGLTDAEQTHLVESSLASCPDAAAELADFRRIQDEMRAGVPQVEPPPGLEDRLMAAIAAPVIAAPPTRRKLHIAWWIGAAAVLALVVTNVYWLMRVNGLNQTIQQRSDDFSAPVQVQGDSSFLLTSSNEIRWVRLPPSQKNTDASAVLLWNVESEIGLMYARNFPELEAGKTYQLWLTRGEERVSAGTFEVDEEGTGALLFHITEPIDEYTWARITEESGDGSSQPSDMVVVVGEL